MATDARIYLIMLVYTLNLEIQQPYRSIGSRTFYHCVPLPSMQARAQKFATNLSTETLCLLIRRHK